jgi:hypothetical protein
LLTYGLLDARVFDALAIFRYTYFIIASKLLIYLESDINQQALIKVVTKFERAEFYSKQIQKKLY